ncbi:hypothetical protein L6452_20798 [Arctium lappa]|uniref:Uncharacterized protein n=1 Tax=Arctium lappa TaxID=4217 RepID=A0ACB9BCX0_ARCLA|nr:hypothetical protein L6452_20798 [Arctium lappa]
MTNEDDEASIDECASDGDDDDIFIDNLMNTSSNPGCHSACIPEQVVDGILHWIILLDGEDSDGEHYL